VVELLGLLLNREPADRIGDPLLDRKLGVPERKVRCVLGVERSDSKSQKSDEAHNSHRSCLRLVERDLVISRGVALRSAAPVS